ncbi:Uncharacterized protein BP5553_09484 [Venustampulla echinocandica]|uniref:BZIP domain-containing protein n=1 Tax=Venustampulla echinocandica TaxID=2656787 RepID=A0A370TCV1_9HELO|nr:Uncharacterized protein BP5553_09484 [Venustampulla echinocandica]RDL32082.1 Uncharacterized protein BP5553_09484 [Venustampulla echinocandica]
MSQRPPASRPASRSPPDGHGIVLPSVQVRDGLEQAGPQVERQRPQVEGRGPQQPLPASPPHSRPSQLALGGEDWRHPGPSRDLGVYSILNPTEPEGTGVPSRRPSGTITDSPLQAVSATSQFGVSRSIGTPHTFAAPKPASGSPPSAEGYGPILSQPRRILTPRSPSRALSLGRGRGRGNIDAHQSPFLPARGRSYTMESGTSSEVPLVPIPPTQSHQHSGYPPSVSTPSNDRRTSMPTMHGPSRAPLSQSASPSISASSQNPSSAQTSPASLLFHKGGHGPQATSSYFPSSTFGTSIQQTPGGGGMQGMQYQGPSGATEGPYSAPVPQTPGGGSSLHSNPAGSSRQTSASDPIQVLTITTSSGQYQVPVDVHQASRLADEKRARNAGASARFRQRRKEKEREASTNIDKLQQQTRDLERKVRETEQERDFYRGERNRLRDAMLSTAEMRHLALQSPPSPVSMRSASSSFQGQGQQRAAQQFGGQQLGGPPNPPNYSSQSTAPAEERAPRRRRMDAQGDFTSLPYSHPPAATLPPVQAPGYPSAPPQGPQSLPPLRMENANASQSPASTQAPTATLGPQPPLDPYSRGPYERGWPGDNSRR